MTNFLNTGIGFYHRVTCKTGTVITLRDFLALDIRVAIEQVRAESDHSRRSLLKEHLLPCATISAIFGTSKKETDLMCYTGLLCIDIDAKENPQWCGRWEDLKTFLVGFPFIGYAGLSASGDGVFAIMPICHPGRVKEHFKAVERDMKEHDIVLDAACSNVNRTRYASYDPAPYINETPTAYCKTVERTRWEPRQQTLPRHFETDTVAEVARLVNIIDREGLDLTNTYADWVNVGFAMADLGEAGREYFHILSAQNPVYNPSECDQKFTELLNAETGKKPITIASFFYICNQWNIK